MMRSSFPYGLSMPSNATEPTTSKDTEFSSSESRKLRDVLRNDGRELLLCCFGDELWIRDESVRECGAAFAAARRRHGFDCFAENFLRVVGVLLKRGHDLRPGHGFVIGMPAVVIGDHSDGAVTEFGFASEFGFGDVGHADDVKFHFAMHVGLGERGELRTFHADVSTLAMDWNGAVNAGVGEDAGDLRASWLVERDMSDDAVAEESGDAALGAIDELISNEKFTRPKIFFKRTDRAD